MELSIEELREGIGVMLTHGDTRAGATYQDRIEISENNSNTPNPENNSNTPNPNYEYRQTTEGNIPHTEILAMFDRVITEMHATYERHARPYSKARRIDWHTYGACIHLNVSYHRAPVKHFPAIEAHVFSNACRVRLCLRCARNQRNVERYHCTTCGEQNPPGRSKLRRRQAVLISEYYEPPIHFYVPMCDNCRLILAHNGYGRPLFIGPPMTGISNGRGAL